jgi:flagellar protein FliT
MAIQLETYEQIAMLSASMVAAARAGDWPRLLELEHQVARLADTLAGDGDGDRLAAVDASRKATLIQQILDDDAEIRRHTEPWMERVRAYLGTGYRQALPACGSA